MKLYLISVSEVPPSLFCNLLILPCPISDSSFLLEWRLQFLMRTTRSCMLWLLTASPASPLGPNLSSWLVFLTTLHFYPIHSSKEPAFQLEVLILSFLCPLKHFSPTSFCLINFCLFIGAQLKLCFLREFYLNLLDLVRFPCNTLHVI